MSSTPKIKDICEKLGLSKATVSKALNGYSSVSETTRVRIMDCAREMGYNQTVHSTDVSARFIRVGFYPLSITGNPEGTSPYQTILGGLLDELSHSHYETVMIPPKILADQNIPYEQAMHSLNLNCAFLTGLKLEDPYALQLRTTTFPTIMWDMRVDNPFVHNISCDSCEGLRLAAEHLIALGHRRIGFICGHLQAEVSLLRRDGYILALLNAGIPYDPELVYYGDFSEASGVLGLHRLIGKGITGLICISDVVALGAMRAAQAMGIQIPEELSIVGYDNMSLTTYLTPGLTSVDQQPDKIGHIAATMIHNVMHDRSVGDVAVHPSLVIRGSTAAPKAK